MNAMTQAEVHTTHTAAALEVADPTKRDSGSLRHVIAGYGPFCFGR